MSMRAGAVVTTAKGGICHDRQSAPDVKPSGWADFVALRKGSDVDIAAAYQRAKRNDPTLTQGQYATRAYPTIAERYRHARGDVERRRIELSGARYHRLVLQGKRSGRINIERGAMSRTGGSVDLFQVFIPVAGQKEWVSFDLTGIGARSTFDINKP